MTDVQASLDRYRKVREELERSVLPLATSVDGSRFTFQTSLHGLELEAGGYVTLDGGGESRLGQVLSLELRTQDASGPDLPQVLIRIGSGEGVVLEGDGHPFHDARVQLAQPERVGAWLDRIRPERSTLQVGELSLAPGVPIDLDAGGFGRHTFICGQSGSGKTYSLGVLLEHLLMETNLRVVVLDPNSDYVRLAEQRKGVEPDAAEHFNRVASSIAVRSGADGPARIRVRFRELSPAYHAALLRFDPLENREEYAELNAYVENENIRSLEDFERVGSDDLLLRARNLGVDRWSIWPGPEGTSLAAELEDPDGPRCIVVDLGSLATREEQALTAGAVLEWLWRGRARREPIAIVIDEAHNVCPVEPEDPITALATQDAIRIAGEGRKFGLYMIVVTQRPQKVHENVISQCENLVLMRMNSTADLGHVGSVFSFVPPGLLDRATTFGQGEALVAGKIASHPALIRFGSRITEEGGADVGGWWIPPPEDTP
jgi:DNA helicase HerA-like ATPase